MCILFVSCNAKSDLFLLRLDLNRSYRVLTGGSVRSENDSGWVLVLLDRSGSACGSITGSG